MEHRGTTPHGGTTHHGTTHGGTRRGTGKMKMELSCHTIDGENKMMAIGGTRSRIGQLMTMKIPPGGKENAIRRVGTMADMKKS